MSKAKASKAPAARSRPVAPPPCDMKPVSGGTCGAPSAWTWTPTVEHEKRGATPTHFCERHHSQNHCGEGNPYWTVARIGSTPTDLYDAVVKAADTFRDLAKAEGRSAAEPPSKDSQEDPQP